MWNRLLTWITCFCLLFSCGCGKKEPNPDAAVSPKPETAELSEQIFGMWFSYIEYRDLCQGMSEEEFSSFCSEAVKNMQSIGINRLYLHAAAFTDAFYDSEIYPRTAVLPDIDYDPFLIFSKTARASGMKVEAWINPMRSVTVSEAVNLPEDFIIRRWIEENNERVRQSGDRYYLNPAYPEVRALIVSVAEEIMNRYEIDGIHMDDYFYPYDTERNFDAYVFSLEQEKNPELTLEEFRTANTDQMVKELHDAVKRKNPKLMFDISPAGNIENCLTMIYANPYHWAQQGTVDYILPQIYWGYLHPIKPFEPTLEEWLKVVEGTKTALVPGLAAYRIGVYQNVSNDDTINREFIENTDLMARQVETSLQHGCMGTAFFSYASFFAPTEETAENVEKEIIHIKNLAGLN